MTTDATPPAWAETILRAVLRRGDSASVSGDLLEEYRETVYPARGRHAADRWYVTQVCGFAIRGVGLWGALLGVAVVARTALDWFVPTHDFSVRSAVSTYVALGLLLATGFWSAWRSGSMRSGALSAVLVAAIGALVSVTGAAGMLAIFHDPQTMNAIAGSGGLSEVFTLPITMVVDGLILGTIGGAVGAAAYAKVRVDPV
jgi:hypothetical protein